MKDAQNVMAELFEPTLLNGMELSNRFVRSATWEGLATKGGAPSPQLNGMMVELVEGQVGLIITGYAFVRADGQSSPGQLAVHDDTCVAGLRTMVEAVHAVGGKIALQMVHAGRFANTGIIGMGTVGPSSVEQDGKVTCQAMSQLEIQGMISAFTQAALRAKQAGFDAIQLHGAHGFLLSQFLSHAFNKRTDNYGGCLENRARFLLEVVRSIRKAVGTRYPLLIKLNSEDFLDDGMTGEEAIQVASLLEEASLDAIELSGGTVASPQEFLPPRPGKQEHEVFYLEAARLYKKRVGIPLMLVGGIRSYQTATELVSGGVADYISLGRPLICEPGLVKRWHDGDRRPSECGSCNGCFEPATAGKGVYCVRLQRKRR